MAYLDDTDQPQCKAQPPNVKCKLPTSTEIVNQDARS